MGDPLLISLLILAAAVLIAAAALAWERHVMSGHVRSDQFCEHWVYDSATSTTPSARCPNPTCQSRRLAWQTGRPFSR